MIDQERNERFWKACGFMWRVSESRWVSPSWCTPAGKRIKKLPGHRLDALFRWAVPKVKEKLGGINITFYRLTSFEFCDILGSECKTYSGRADTSAEALFLACEKAFGLDRVRKGKEG